MLDGSNFKWTKESENIILIKESKSIKLFSTGRPLQPTGRGCATPSSSFEGGLVARFLERQVPTFIRIESIKP